MELQDLLALSLSHCFTLSTTPPRQLGFVKSKHRSVSCHISLSSQQVPSTREGKKPGSCEISWCSSCVTCNFMPIWKVCFSCFLFFLPLNWEYTTISFFFFSVIEIMMSARNFERIFFMPVYTKFSAKHLVNHCYSFSSVRLALQMQLCLSAFKKRSNWHFKLGFKKSVVTSLPF